MLAVEKLNVTLIEFKLAPLHCKNLKYHNFAVWMVDGGVPEPGLNRRPDQ